MSYNLYPSTRTLTTARNVHRSNIKPFSEAFAIQFGFGKFQIGSTPTHSLALLDQTSNINTSRINVEDQRKPKISKIFPT